MTTSFRTIANNHLPEIFAEILKDQKDVYKTDKDIDYDVYINQKGEVFSYETDSITNRTHPSMLVGQSTIITTVSKVKGLDLDDINLFHLVVERMNFGLNEMQREENNEFENALYA